MSIVILASELEQKRGQRVEGLGPHAAAGIQVGSGDSINPKYWPCEDSLALHELEDGSHLAAVADAHWGGSSSEAVASQLLEAWHTTDAAKSPLKRLLTALDGIESSFQASREDADASETTVLIAHVKGRTMSYLSVGDSLLLAVTRKGCKLWNRPSGVFLGREPLAIYPGDPIDAGIVTLRAGQIVLLATDGLEPEASGLGHQDVARELSHKASLEYRLDGLLRLASDPSRGAGRDNLGVVAIEVR